MIRFCRIAVLREVEEMIRFDGSLNLFHFYVDTFSITSILMLSKKEKPYKQAKMLKYQRLITKKNMFDIRRVAPGKTRTSATKHRFFVFR